MIYTDSSRNKWPNNLIFAIYEIPKNGKIILNQDIVYIGEYLMSCRDLTREEYIILEMSFRHKKSSMDIADMLGMEERKVQVHKYNALSKLKKSKEKEEIDERELAIAKVIEYRKHIADINKRNMNQS